MGGGGHEKCCVCFCLIFPGEQPQGSAPCPPCLGAGIWLSLDLNLFHFLHLNTVSVTEDPGHAGKDIGLTSIFDDPKANVLDALKHDTAVGFVLYCISYVP